MYSWHVNLTFIVKTTFQCNMRCQYCYEGDRPRDGGLPIEFALMLIDKIGEYFGGRNGVANIVWHGGEPLLIGLDYYARVVDRQSKYSGNVKFNNFIQTNGTLVDDRMAEFLTRSAFKVGVSLDGPPCVHNIQRPLSFGGDSFEKGLEAIRIFRRMGNRVRALAVFTRRSFQHIESFYDFFSSRGIDFKVNPLLDIGSALHHAGPGLHISPREYAEALCYLYDRWVAEPEYRFSVEPFEGILGSLLYGKSRSCSFSGNCGQYLKINPDGSVRPCGKKDDDTFLLGNVEFDSIGRLLSSKILSDFKASRKRVADLCSNCCHFDICRGGCTTSACTNGGDISGRDYFCESYKAVFDKIKLSLR